MIRITKITDYGIVLLTRFALAPAGSVQNTRDLALETRIPQPMVGKILKTLAREGLLDSRRGVNGGYTLARAAREITVARIVDALEGPIAITECTGEHGADHANCSMEHSCPVTGHWHRINGVVMQALESITLEEMANPFTAAARGAAESPANGRTGILAHT